MKHLFVSLAILSLPLSSVRASEQDTVDRCAIIVREFRHMPEKGIPRDVLRHAKGLAIISVLKAGFIFSGKAGNGLVVARTERDWSGPSFIATGGAGWGAQIGAQVTDYVFVLNNDAAVRAFSRGGNVTLGADASIAAGPVGRTAEAGITRAAAIYAYSRSKGLFAGISLEGAVIATQSAANARYYGQQVKARQILQGDVPPPTSAGTLRASLAR
ncbi:MAG: YSC84-related protein [Verrucomicrobiota bacterium]